jgi:predicted O-methyltransferase YrrM
MSVFEGTALVVAIALAISGLVAFQRLTSRIDAAEAARDAALANQFRQVEALASLYQLLRPRMPLPPTRDWAGSPDFLRVVAEHALMARPRTIVECGSGVSTVVLARCVELNGAGHVYSLEHDAEYAVRTRELLASHALSDFATVIDAPLVDVELADWKGRWYDVADLAIDGKVDALIVDGPPFYASELARYPAGPMLFDRLQDGGAIILDDADRRAEREIVDRWSRRYPKMVPMKLDACEKGCLGYRWGAHEPAR